MRHKAVTTVVALFFVFAVALVRAQDADVVTGGHVLSAMMTPDSNSCTVSVTGSLDPKFKGADTAVDLICQNATCPTCAPGPVVVGTTRQCTVVDGCFNTIDQCTGKFAFTVQGTLNSDSSCTLQAPPNFVCYFVAHVTSTNRQQCKNGSAPDASAPDPSGTAPCSGDYCP